MRVLVDGVFYQLATTGIARVWTSLLSHLSRMDDLDIAILDRGRCPKIEGVERIPFPSYTSAYTATDSLLIEKVCGENRIDVFTSTYYTTAVETPQVLMVYDMIPEVLGYDLSARVWKEKYLALHYAARLACISRSTRDDLHRLFPEIDPARSVVTHCGVDAQTFNPGAAENLPALRQSHGLDRPYVIIVGSREQHLGYKNARMVFDAISVDRSADLDILCIGGEPKIPPEWTRPLPERVRARRLDLSDAELATIYAGAVALVYPSLYEGFGMPVVEAMASGCPVITTRHGSLAEVAGDAALIVSGQDRYELLSGLHRTQEPEQRRRMVAAGFRQAALFDWQTMAERIRDLLVEARNERSDAEVDRFHRRWRKLRSAQADVDVGLD